MKRSPLSRHEFTKTFAAGLPALTEALENTYAEGSRNQIMQGDGFCLPWQGLSGQGDNTGSRLMRQVLQTWGGLKDYNVGSIAIEGKGSFFSDIGKSLWFIGSGQPNIEGIPIAPGVFASTELQVSIAVNGVYSAANTFDAGLPQPSTPDIGIISTPGFGFTGLIQGPVSCKIARLRLTTGARSIASPTSAVINPQKKTIRVTFPLPAQGQDYWAVFFTQSGFGGVGLHYRVAYQDSLDIAESVVAAGIIDGIPRSLEFDFKDGDLIPEVAYIDDYPPPAGTHAVRLANVMCVLGAYGDSTAPVTAADPGTVGAISLPNFYESYKPRYLVYFPEQIVDVMARPTDEYAYVGHRNCITALQYVGVQDGPAVAVSMVWPDIGIAKPHNWCQVHGLLYTFQAKGGPVRMMPDGSPDYSFAAPVRRYMRDWTIEETVVGSHPDSLSVVYFNGREALSWSLQAQKWSPPCFLDDICIEDAPNPSSSPSASFSPSTSPSASPSASVSRSPSASPSASISQSPSSSPSASPSSSASSSPSSSGSSSPSSSPSASPSASESPSPSASPSSSPSASPSGSGSSSPSASPSSSPSSSASASAPPPFSPSSLASIWEWWEPSRDTYNDNDTISLLTGQFASKNFARDVGNRPVYKANILNGLGVADFAAGGGQALEGPNASALTAGHMFLVILARNDPGVLGRATPWRIGTDGTNPDLYPFTSGTIFCGAGSTARKSIANPAASLTSWRVFEVISTSSEFTVLLDGTQLSTTATNTVGFHTQIELGSGPGGGTYDGQIAGVYICSAKLSAPDRADMVDYLNTRFALSIV